VITRVLKSVLLGIHVPDGSATNVVESPGRDWFAINARDFENGHASIFVSLIEATVVADLRDHEEQRGDPELLQLCVKGRALVFVESFPLVYRSDVEMGLDARILPVVILVFNETNVSHAEETSHWVGKRAALDDGNLQALVRRGKV